MLIEDEDLWGTRGLKLVGDRVAAIFEHRKTNLVATHIGVDFRERILQIGIDTDHGNSPAFVPGQ